MGRIDVLITGGMKVAITRRIIYLARPNNTIKCGTTVQFVAAVLPLCHRPSACCVGVLLQNVFWVIYNTGFMV